MHKLTASIWPKSAGAVGWRRDVELDSDLHV